LSPSAAVLGASPSELLASPRKTLASPSELWLLAGASLASAAAPPACFVDSRSAVCPRAAELPDPPSLGRLAGCEAGDEGESEEGV
jgi:hypothetical protein